MMVALTRIIIASDNRDFLQALTAKIRTAPELAITDVCTTGAGLAEKILDMKPDALILDLMLPGANALSILNQLHEAPQERRPVIFVLSAFASAYTVAECSRLGAGFFLRAPVDTAFLTDLLRRYGAERQPLSRPCEQPTEQELFRRVTQILRELQLPTHVVGYRYTRECIMLTLEDPELADSVTKLLYPAVASKYKTTWTSVERDIRSAIELAWKANNGVLHGFGFRRRPTNRKFILAIADRIRCELQLDDRREGITAVR